MPSTSPSVEELILLLEKHLIPLWENVGLEHLVVGAATQEDFLLQPMPKQMRVSAKQSTPPTNRATKAQNASSATLLFVAEGQVDIDLGDYVLHCPQGHFVLLRPETLGQQQEKVLIDNALITSQNCRVAWFTLLSRNNNILLRLSKSREQSFNINNNNFCLISNPETTEFFRFFIQEILNTSEGYRKTAAESVYIFFVLVLRGLQEGYIHYATRTTAITSSSQLSSPIEAAQQYIQKHLRSHLTLDRVARVVLMSRTNFVRRFPAETGQTFNKYVTTIRLKEAVRMLKEEEWPIKNICEHVGLKPAQFRKRFKETYGVSPITFRKRSK